MVRPQCMADDSRMLPTILDLAARQHGVVTRAQLAAAGVAGHRMDYRLRTGLLTRIHRGVYRVGPVVAPWMRQMAAVLACGPDAVLSHGSAAGLWEITDPPAPDEPVHVSVPRRIRGPAHGVRVHGAFVEPNERGERFGIPVTDVPRTLLDLVGGESALAVEAALAQAEASGLVTFEEVTARLAAHRGRAGSRGLRAALEGFGGPALTRSKAERRLLRLLRKAEIPPPRVNEIVHGLEVDFTWPDRRVAVEVDGYEFHCGRPAFERDRRRDTVLTGAGWRVLRITWRQLDRRPEAFLAQLAGALAAAA